MRLALYHPRGGYYAQPANPDPFTSRGDYYTSPAVHPAFGALLSAQLRRMWQLIGSPPQFTAVEVGAGSGILSQDIAAAAPAISPQFAAALRCVAIDRRAPPMPPDNPSPPAVPVQRLRAQTIPLRPIIGCIISNELIDALPVHRYQMRKGKPAEIFVTLTPQGAFAETLAPPSTPAIPEYIAALPSPQPEGARGEVRPDADAYIAAAAISLRAGFVITIDYGGSAQDLRARMPRGSVQTYYRHTEGSSPYQRVGRQDITAHADFTQLQAAGNRAGLTTAACATQADLLRSLGIDDLIQQARAARAQHSAAALRRLTDPAGLGAFKILIQQKPSPAFPPITDPAALTPPEPTLKTLPPTTPRHMPAAAANPYHHAAFAPPAFWHQP